MATKPKTLCRACRRNTTRDGLCEACKAKGEGKRRDERQGSTARGYDARWQRFRLWYLRDNPLCQDCKEQDRITPATEIHHKQRLAKNPELKYLSENLVPLCHRCHSVRTARGE